MDLLIKIKPDLEIMDLLIKIKPDLEIAFDAEVEIVDFDGMSLEEIQRSVRRASLGLPSEEPA